MYESGFAGPPSWGHNLLFWAFEVIQFWLHFIVFRRHFYWIVAFLICFDNFGFYFREVVAFWVDFDTCGRYFREVVAFWAYLSVLWRSVS